ncbi:dTDP-4-dehydrorhamnose 3,5-epimerase family protein [Kitasatospora azatica]|uniref:dTDP-4-dehydrorhamnose 3,5-epimerase family protein n=1 Tax=Kitasatospora azatica TaxID=58347 RepID=UPI00056AC960|nr:dTDP-4-dehydrorhamnose 3,5-epimerase family protein [Kitasatospora azatica]
MEIEETAVPDAYRITPRVWTDERGSFHESFRSELLERATGHAFTPRQVNYSTSRRNVLRGLHGVELPPGQAKFVTCVRGSVFDVVVDVRLGSPTFGAYTTSVLDAGSGCGVYVAEGLAHGFVALTEDACVSYLCSTEFVPGTQVDIDPLDAQLGVPWQLGLTGEALMSPKDAGALSLERTAQAGRLAGYRECLAHYAAKRPPRA